MNEILINRPSDVTIIGARHPNSRGILEIPTSIFQRKSNGCESNAFVGVMMQALPEHQLSERIVSSEGLRSGSCVAESRTSTSTF